MNAAFLLVATAWASGAEPVPAPIHSAPAHGACTGCGHAHHGYFDGGCCEDDCDKPGLLDRLRGMFRKPKDCCETECDTGCHTSCDSGCDSGCGSRGLLYRFRSKGNDCCEDPCHSHGGDCGCECDSCCDKPSFFDRLRGFFRRDKCCEEDCCDPCFGGAVIHAPHAPAVAPKAEKIPPPKGDGDAGKGDAGKEVGKLPIGAPRSGNIPEVIPSPTTIREPF